MVMGGADRQPAHEPHLVPLFTKLWPHDAIALLRGDIEGHTEGVLIDHDISFESEGIRLLLRHAGPCGVGVDTLHIDFAHRCCQGQRLRGIDLHVLPIKGHAGGEFRAIHMQLHFGASLGHLEIIRLLEWVESRLRFNLHLAVLGIRCDLDCLDDFIEFGGLLDVDFVLVGVFAGDGPTCGSVRIGDFNRVDLINWPNGLVQRNFTSQRINRRVVVALAVDGDFWHLCRIILGHVESKRQGQ
mmetsp:Transcript_56950/g.144478  ORF Transcript_56950/g.144478 Transcript_56950/m.144478 type:complete len:242 (-) Transcript_56950:193-918(-)